MKPEEINAAILKWMGYSFSMSGAFIGWRNPIGVPIRDSELPNHYGDRNEIHKAIMHLSEEKRSVFTIHVMNLIPLNQCEVWSVATMEAPKLCEALLRTINLWRDS